MLNPKLTITNKVNNFLLEIKRASGFLWAAKRKSGLKLWKFRASAIFENAAHCVAN